MATPVPADFTVTVPVNTPSPGNVTVSNPSTTVDGDLLLVAIGVGNESSSGQTITPPVGWTQQGTIYGNNTYLSVFTKFASSEPSSWNFAVSNSIGSQQFRMGSCARITDAYVAGPVDAISFDTQSTGIASSGGPITYANSVTPVISSDLIIILPFITSINGPGTVSNSQYAVATSNPGAWSELFDSFGIVLTSRQVSMSLGYATRPQTTSTGNPSIFYNTAIGPTTAVSAVALIAVRRNTLASVRVSDSVTTTDTMRLNSTTTISTNDTVSTIDMMYATGSKVWQTVTKAISSWIKDSKH